MFKPTEKLKKEEGFDSKVLDLARVTKVTAGGKQLKFRAVVVVGNRNGKVGIGVAKERMWLKVLRKLRGWQKEI